MVSVSCQPEYTSDCNQYGNSESLCRANECKNKLRQGNSFCYDIVEWEAFICEDIVIFVAWYVIIEYEAFIYEDMVIFIATQDSLYETRHSVELKLLSDNAFRKQNSILQFYCL